MKKSALELDNYILFKKKLDTSRISIGKVSERIGIKYVTDADT
jgi:hypothetical protein